MRYVHLILLFLVAAPAFAAEGDGVRVSMSGASTPYAVVEFAVVEKRGTVVAEVIKTYAADFGRDERVGLLPRDEYDALVGALERLGAYTLPDAVAKAPRVTWQVEARRAGRGHRFRVTDPELLDDRRYAALLARVAAVVAEHAGAVPFRDRMLLPSEAGRLEVRATPRARVWLDEVALPGWTPIPDLRVAAGRHRLRLVSETGVAREYEVKVDVGGTTSLSVELK